jgi:hypothetical protein
MGIKRVSFTLEIHQNIHCRIMLKRTRSGTIAPFSFPPHGHPIRWNFDMKEILTLEFQQLAKREKKIPYYRGKTSVRPRPGTEPLSDSEDDGEDEVDDDAAMTSDISDDESATGKNDEDMSSSESSESEEEVVSPLAKLQAFNISDPLARRSPFPPRRDQPKYS